MADTWIGQFPGLAALEPAISAELARIAQVADLPAGQTVFTPGDECRNYLMVLSGSVRVLMTAENGREIVLYRVAAGETCVLTTACLLAHEAYSAEGVTETPVRAAVVPAGPFLDLLGRSNALRGFVFAAYGNRVADLMLLVEEIAFGRLDLRLARFLVQQESAKGMAMTHQALAVELGTAREVVSRQLKEFERRGWVALHRGRIEVLDQAALSGFADHS